MSFANHVSGLVASGPALCVGIDPHPAVLTEWGFQDSPAGLKAFVGSVVAGVRESGVSVVKPQVALFERHGVGGLSALSELLGELRKQAVVSIGDAKRGDIGSTMRAYAEAWLSPRSDFEVDALTVSPYLGVGAVLPALELGAEQGKGVFVLAATSNPEARGLQGARLTDDVTVAQRVVTEVSAFHAQYPESDSTHGVVVGATVDQESLGLALAPVPGMPVLAPGFGAQGVALSRARELFPQSHRVFPVVARSVLTGGPEGFVERINQALQELAP